MTCVLLKKKKERKEEKKEKRREKRREEQNEISWYVCSININRVKINKDVRSVISSCTASVWDKNLKNGISDNATVIFLVLLHKNIYRNRETEREREREKEKEKEKREDASRRCFNKKKKKRQKKKKKKKGIKKNI